MSRIQQKFTRDNQPQLSYTASRDYLRQSSSYTEANEPVINPSISEFRPSVSLYSPKSLRNRESRLGLMGSLLFHALIGFLLVYDASNSRAVLVNESQNMAGLSLPHVSPLPAQPEIIKAVSVNSQQVNEAVESLKKEREQAKRAEAAHQQQLTNQAEAAKQNRLKEEKRLSQLKEESEKIAILRKKQLQEQEDNLKKLTIQKEAEAKRLQALKTEQTLLKKQQEVEAKKALALKQKQDEEKRLADKAHAEQKSQEQAKAEKERASIAALAHADAVKRQEAAARQAQMDAANQARVSGEVDKYKALIIDAIGRQWILPDTVNRNLSSQFRIRLAPDGGVLEVSLIRSSGDPILDRSAQTAIYKASPLPVPGDPTTFNMFRDISLTVRPENVRG